MSDVVIRKASNGYVVWADGQMVVCADVRELWNVLLEKVERPALSFEDTDNDE